MNKHVKPTALPTNTGAPNPPKPLVSRSPPQRATTQASGATMAAISQLMKVESDARHAGTLRELDNILANEGRTLLRGRQAFVVQSVKKSARVIAVSSLANIDRSGPMMIWLEQIVASLAAQCDISKPQNFMLPAYAEAGSPLTRDYPYRSLLWQPLWTQNADKQIGLLVTRETAWTDADQKIAQRLSETFGHARRALTHAPSQRHNTKSSRKVWIIAALASLLAGLIPVPMAVLAPLEVVPRDADVVAMPIDGIVQHVLVSPNAAVVAGTPLVQLVDTIPRNKLEVATREVAVAEARLEKANSLAFSDPRGRQDLGIVRAELALKRAERNYARDLFDATIIKAQAAGTAVFSDPKELEGKPVSTGDRLMLIARPHDIELKIDLAVADSIVLQPGLHVRAFLDSDPLHAALASVSYVDYQAKVSAANIASYRLTARLTDPGATLNLGARGTAQIRGPHLPLIIYVLRRPLSAIRQWTGL